MNTIIRYTDSVMVDPDVIKDASDLLWRGGLVAFPTETVYGLGADGWNEDGARRIYEAKGRPSDNPLILHIADRCQLSELVAEIPESAERLMDAFWPGPLTLIFDKAPAVPYGVTGGLDTVAIRMPSHPVAQALLKRCRLPIAAPSANTSGRPSPTKANHVIEDLDGRVDMIIDGGEVGIGIESTIVDVTCDPLVILRPGYITLEMLEGVVDRVQVDPAVTSRPQPGMVPRAPGMKYRHYAPRAQLTLVQGEPLQAAMRIQKLVREELDKGRRVGILATDETSAVYDAGHVISMGSRSDLLSVSHNLYWALREFDHSGEDVLFGETFPEEGLGGAVMNRLRKAAGFRML